jgi:hypothetical protein
VYLSLLGEAVEGVLQIELVVVVELEDSFANHLLLLHQMTQ